MDNVQRQRRAWWRRVTSGGDASLEELAVLDAYIAACRSGHPPQLAEYLARYPDHAEALLDAAMLMAPLLHGGEVHPANAASTLSEGTQRALQEILDIHSGELLDPRVAERRSAYLAEPDSGAPQPALLSLIAQARLTLEETAAAAGCPPEELLAFALHPATLSPELANRLAHILGMPPEALTAALDLATD